MAEIIVDRVASVDMVRFCNSGSEAIMNALRAARAFTGRDLIVKMEGGYHGTYDDVEVSVHPDPRDPASGPDHAPTGVLGTRGVPGNTIDNVLVTPLNDIDAVERLMRERGAGGRGGDRRAGDGVGRHAAGGPGVSRSAPSPHARA